MNLNPFVILLSNIISLYSTGFILWIIIGWLIRFDVINGYQPFVKRVMSFFNRVFEPALIYIRKFLPLIGGLDLSPIVLILLLSFAKELLFTYIYKI